VEIPTGPELARTTVNLDLSVKATHDAAGTSYRLLLGRETVAEVMVGPYESDSDAVRALLRSLLA
jgi:hypothetical protein